MARAARRRRSLTAGMPATIDEVVLGLDVLEQAEPLGLDDLLLEPPHAVARSASSAVGVGAVEELAELDAGHAGGQLGEALRRQLRASREPVGRAHRLEVLEALGARRARTISTSRVAVRAHQLRVELGQALGRPARRRCSWPAAPGPAPTCAGRPARRGPRACGRRRRRRAPGSRRTAGAAPPAAPAAARRSGGSTSRAARRQFGGVARQRLRPGGAVHRVVGLQPLVEVRCAPRRGEAEALGAVVGDDRRPAGEQLVGAGSPRAAGSAGPSVPRTGHEVGRSRRGARRCWPASLHRPHQRLRPRRQPGEEVVVRNRRRRSEGVERVRVTGESRGDSRGRRPPLHPERSGSRSRHIANISP